ncbi:hypothetical protein GH131_10390, partial [Staphylococcus pseudintermedius]|nr:hypothetical protein [Staphylococcus pseudintermedius]
MKSRILKRTPNKNLLKIIEANGSYIKDQKGKSYLDMASNAMICNLGYNHYEIKNTINNAYRKLSYCHNGSFNHDNQELLAHRLNSLLKEDYYVYFCSSGSETIEAAIRFVYLYQKTLGYSNRKKMMAFEESYHGSSLGALSITGAPAVREKWGGITTNVRFIGRNPSNNTIEEVLNDDIGGFFVEPLSSNATGTIEYPAKSMENIHLKLKKNRQLIVFDEISTSIGRTGTNFFFEQQNLSFSPDIICTSKGLGVGYFNIGAVLVKKEVADNLINSEIPLLGHSYNGHPVGTSIGLKVIEILERDNFLKKIEMNSN